MEREILTASGAVWVILGIALILHLLWLNHHFIHRLGLSFRALFSRRHLIDLRVDDQVYAFRPTLFLTLHLFVLVLALVWIDLRFGHQMNPTKAWTTLLFTAKTLGYYLVLKSLAMFVIGLVSNQKQVFMAQLYYSATLRSLLAVLLTPFLILAPMMNPENIFGFEMAFASIVIIGLLVKFIEGIRWLRHYNLSQVEIILYFCALELVPLGIGLQILTN